MSSQYELLLLWLCSYYSHYFIVVINATITDTPSVELVENDDLGPHSSYSRYYVAAVILSDNYNHDEPFVLGNESKTVFEGVEFTNAPITLGTYRYFVRAYTVGPVSQFMK